MQIYFSLLMAVLGLLLYVLATNPKNQEIGRIMFFAGLLAFLLGGGAGHLLSIIPNR